MPIRGPRGRLDPTNALYTLAPTARPADVAYDYTGPIQSPAAATNRQIRTASVNRMASTDDMSLGTGMSPIAIDSDGLSILPTWCTPKLWVSCPPRTS